MLKAAKCVWICDPKNVLYIHYRIYITDKNSNITVIKIVIDFKARIEKMYIYFYVHFNIHVTRRLIAAY